MYPLVILAFVWPTISTGIAASLLNIAAGYAGQWAKAHPFVPTPAVQGALMVAGLACYGLSHHPTAQDAEWLENGIMWVLAVPGAASLAGSFKVAPPTSKEGK